MTDDGYLADRHPGTTGLLRWLEHDHLPLHLQVVVRPFHRLAHALVAEYPDHPELTTALRKLVEAKDAAVRCVVDVMDGLPGTTRLSRPARNIKLDELG
jgi:hypothetical protein